MKEILTTNCIGVIIACVGIIIAMGFYILNQGVIIKSLKTEIKLSMLKFKGR